MSRGEKPVLISVVGPTAVGKTDLAILIAKKYRTEIISSDSRQFYRELEVGTAKPSSEELTLVKHHLVNNLSIHDYYSVGKFEEDVLKVLEELFSDREIAVMVGGSGLYCQAIWQGIDKMPKVDPEIREELNSIFKKEGILPLQHELEKRDPAYFAIVDRQNHARLIRALEVIRSTNKTFSSFRSNSTSIKRPFDMINLGLEMQIESLYRRIEDRMDLMIQNGLFQEAEEFFECRELNALQTVGYQEIHGFMSGQYDREEAIRLLKRNSRRYAKRQMTWFKKNKTIEWFSLDESSDGSNKVLDYLSQKLN